LAVTSAFLRKAGGDIAERYLFHELAQKVKAGETLAAHASELNENRSAHLN